MSNDRSAKPAMSDLADPQAKAELNPKSVGFDPTTDPGDMGIDTAQLFKQAMEQTRMAICISDPNEDDCPIIFVNQAFEDLTGYDRAEVVGRNCRFLQGPDTDEQSIARIRQTVADEEVRVVEVLNYRKDGTAFWNALHVGPIYDEAGRLTHYYGSQWDVTDLIEEREKAYLQKKVSEELQHRTNNLFTVISAIVRLSARDAGDTADLADKISDRIQALSRAHQVSIAPGGERSEASDLHALAEAILRPYRTGARGEIAVSGPALTLPPDAMRSVGLALHELSTNALKYGALGVPGGHVSIEWGVEGQQVVLRWAETGGPKIEDGRPDAVGSGMGMRIVQGVTQAAGGRLETEWRAEGLRATLRLAA